MALTILFPGNVTPAYNPIIVSATSNVRADFTIGSAKTISSISQSGGYAVLNFTAAHGLLKGDFVLITSAPGATEYQTKALVIAVLDSDSVKISLVYTNAITSNGTAYKYINNYSCQVKFYIYVNAAPTTEIYVASKTVVPKFVGGFCYFEIDVAPLVKAYNFEAYEEAEVLGWDLFSPDDVSPKINNHSFVKWGIELFEAFDNPAGGFPEYQQDVLPS